MVAFFLLVLCVYFAGHVVWLPFWCTPTLSCAFFKVMIVGPSFSGKSASCRILANYACRMYRTPLLVDVDPNDVRVCVWSVVRVCDVTMLHMACFHSTVLAVALCYSPLLCCLLCLHSPVAVWGLFTTRIFLGCRAVWVLPPSHNLPMLFWAFSRRSPWYVIVR